MTRETFLQTDWSGATVFLIDDDSAVLDALRLLVESVGLKVATFNSALEFLESFNPQTPGCIVLDVRMPGMSGLELQERLVAQGVETPIILISGYGDVAMAVRAMKAGAVDFIEKPFSDQVLLDCVHTALQQDAGIRAERAITVDILRRLALLSPRERTVMEMVVSGMSNKSIAAELGLSQKTVEVHRARVMAKTEAGSLAELVQMAIRVGASGPVESTWAA